jgi:hypothetical protein
MLSFIFRLQRRVCGEELRAKLQNHLISFQNPVKTGIVRGFTDIFKVVCKEFPQPVIIRFLFKLKIACILHVFNEAIRSLFE